MDYKQFYETYVKAHPGVKKQKCQAEANFIWKYIKGDDRKQKAEKKGLLNYIGMFNRTKRRRQRHQQQERQQQQQRQQQQHRPQQKQRQRQMISFRSLISTIIKMNRQQL